MPVNLLEFISDRLSQQYTSTEDSSSTLQLPVSESIQWSLNSYLESNFLSGKNDIFSESDSVSPSGMGKRPLIRGNLLFQ